MLMTKQHLTLTLLTILIGLSSFGQSFRPGNISIDSIEFQAYVNADSAYSSLVGISRYVQYRRADGKAAAGLLFPEGFSIYAEQDDSSTSKSIFSAAGVQMALYNQAKTKLSGLNLSHTGIQYQGNYHQFEGFGVLLPRLEPNAELPNDNLPEGAIFENTETKGLFKSVNGNRQPAFLEYFDPKAAVTSTSIYYGYPDSWINRLNAGIPIPMLRIPHPLNVTGVPYPVESAKYDFIIAPYEYGMLMRYSGILEIDVPELSVHVGTTAAELDLELNGKQGHGAVLWVGDDGDGGGLRATARDKNGLRYAELSSERFNGSGHGPLRLRVADSTDRIQFVFGGRGSQNILASVGIDTLGTVLQSHGQRPLILGTASQPYSLLLADDGKIGIGTLDPESRLDISAPGGVGQLRLRQSITPTGSGDPRGKVGDLGWDDQFIYIKTAQGWKRSPLQTF